VDNVSVEVAQPEREPSRLKTPRPRRTWRPWANRRARVGAASRAVQVIHLALTPPGANDRE